MSKLREFGDDTLFFFGLIVVCLYDLPSFSFADSFDSLFDTTMDQLILHSFLNQLNEFLAHLITSKWVSNR